MTHWNDEVDRTRAYVSPGDVFRTPEDLVEHAGFTREEKIELLRRWSYDAAELAVAEEEGMGGGGESFLGRIRLALRDLGADRLAETAGLTKHGSIPAPPPRG